jgi:SAM-dependent methyltransferase
VDRRRIKAALMGLDPERLRAAWLSRQIQRLPCGEFASSNGRLPLRPGLRRVILGNRRPATARPSAPADQVKLLEGVLERHRIDPDSRIVEIGCHEGRLLDHLARRGFRDLRGVDFAPYHGSDLTEGRSQEGVAIDWRGFEDADIQGCELIFSFDTFEHLAEWRLFLRRAWEGLAPGGMVYVHYNAFAGINGAHSPGTVDVPWGHVFLKEEEHVGMVREQDPACAEENERFVVRDLNRVDLPSVNRELAALDARGSVLAAASAGDRLLFRRLFEGFEAPYVSEELFVRQVEIFLHRS